MSGNSTCSIKSILPAAWLGYQWLKFPNKAFLVWGEARHQAGLKTKPLKRGMNIPVGSKAIELKGRDLAPQLCMQSVQ